MLLRVMPQISDYTRAKIVEFEIGSRAYYDKFASRPVWPGGASGITLGIGYDLGQHTAADFRHDWAGTGFESRDNLAAVCGHSGTNAKWLLHTCQDVTVPFDVAVDVFDRTVLPRYIAMTIGAFPNASKLSPDALGVLVELVFNRGTSMAGDSRAEMLAIRNALGAGNLGAVPSCLRAMKRLWPLNKSLLARREWEAATFEKAIGKQAAPVLPVKSHPSAEPDLRDTSSDVLNEQELERVRRINYGTSDPMGR